jgi:hypothetical protein
VHSEQYGTFIAAPNFALFERELAVIPDYDPLKWAGSFPSIMSGVKM